MAFFLLHHGVEFLDGAIDAGATDVPVRDHADGVESRVLCPDAALVQGVAEFDGVHATGAAIEDDDVGLYAGGIDLQTGNFRHAFREMPRVGVVFV